LSRTKVEGSIAEELLNPSRLLTFISIDLAPDQISEQAANSPK